MALAPGVHARLWGHHLRHPSRAGNYSTGRFARPARSAWRGQNGLAADSASGWGANCRRFATGLHRHPNRPVPDCQRCQSAYPLAQRSRCGSRRQPDVSSCWSFAHWCPRRSPAHAEVGQNCQAAEPGENCPLLSCRARHRRRSLRPMGVRRQNRSHLAVWMALVADQDSGRGFLRWGADVGLLWRATDRRPYNATFLPLCLCICWKCCHRVRCHL